MIEAFSRLATMNGALLKELSLEDVLALHPLLDAQKLAYRRAIKVKPIRAKPLSCILNDNSVVSKILLATLEGAQTLKASSFVCWGVANDIWQQTGEKLHANYSPVSVDSDGWTLFVPKSDAPRNVCQITEEAAADAGFAFGPCGGFSIVNPNYGDERVLDGRQVYLHYGVKNDYVNQMPEDLIDTYRVDRKFFENTYEWTK